MDRDTVITSRTLRSNGATFLMARTFGMRWPNGASLSQIVTAPWYGWYRRNTLAWMAVNLPLADDAIALLAQDSDPAVRRAAEERNGL